MITLRWQWDIKRQISFICPDHVMSLWSLRGSAFAWRTALSNRTSSSLLAHTTPKEPTAQAPWCGTRNPCCHSLKQRGLGNQLEMDVSLSLSPFHSIPLSYSTSSFSLPLPLYLSVLFHLFRSLSSFFPLYLSLLLYLSFLLSPPLYYPSLSPPSIYARDMERDRSTQVGDGSLCLSLLPRLVWNVIIWRWSRNLTFAASWRM